MGTKLSAYADVSQPPLEVYRITWVQNDYEEKYFRDDPLEVYKITWVQNNVSTL